jgi:hypothetical protein
MYMDTLYIKKNKPHFASTSIFFFFFCSIYCDLKTTHYTEIREVFVSLRPSYISVNLKNFH